MFKYFFNLKYFFSGTRIIYERKFLMQLKSSPLAKTPPKNLPVIPGVTVKDDSSHHISASIPEEPQTTKG